MKTFFKLIDDELILCFLFNNHTDKTAYILWCRANPTIKTEWNWAD